MLPDCRNPISSAARGNGWRVASPQTAGSFTAVGFFFAREIVQQTGVPIGLIDDNWGGTNIEPWIAPAGLANVPEMAALKLQVEQQKAMMVSQLNDVLRWTAEVKQALAENRSLPRPIDLQTVWPSLPGRRRYSTG